MEPIIVVEKHDDGFVAYPLGVQGAVVAQGDSYDEVTANVKSAIAFHVETFGTETPDGTKMQLTRFSFDPDSLTLMCDSDGSIRRALLFLRHGGR